MPIFNFNVTNNVINKNNNLKETPSQFGYTLKDLNRICVYAHYYDNEKNPFYIGQGRISRAYAFNNTVRNKSWWDKVKNISLVHVEIIHIDISIEQSIKFEKELINQYGTLYDNTGILTNENKGGKNSQLGKDNYFYDKHYYKENNANYGNKYNNNNLSIPILQIDVLGNVVKRWSSATEAEEIGGFCAGPISGCCSGKRNIHKWYQWVYEKDYDINKCYVYNPGPTNDRIYILESVFAYNGNLDIIVALGSKELKNKGFNPKKVNNVIHGRGKQHHGYYCIDYFNSDINIQNKYIEFVKKEIATKI